MSRKGPDQVRLRKVRLDPQSGEGHRQQSDAVSQKEEKIQFIRFGKDEKRVNRKVFALFAYDYKTVRFQKKGQEISTILYWHKTCY